MMLTLRNGPQILQTMIFTDLFYQQLNKSIEKIMNNTSCNIRFVLTVMGDKNNLSRTISPNPRSLETMDVLPPIPAAVCLCLDLSTTSCDTRYWISGMEAMHWTRVSRLPPLRSTMCRCFRMNRSLAEADLSWPLVSRYEVIGILWGYEKKALLLDFKKLNQ